MRATAEQITELIVPVAGAGNIGSGARSTAAVHLLPLRSRLESGPHRRVSQPIVPQRLGLFGDLPTLFERFCDEVDLVSDDQPDAELVLVGHSLGGLFARRYAALRQTKVAGVVSLAAPHGPLNDRVPHYYRDAYADFSAATDEIDRFTQTRVACIASKHDELVPVTSATLDSKNAENYVIGWRLPITHNLIPMVPPVTRLTRSLVDAMIEHTVLQSPGEVIARPA
jgi:pimeloyl-ACP methyl ester carboxylesterase